MTIDESTPGVNEAGWLTVSEARWVSDARQRVNRAVMEGTCQAAATMIRQTLEDVGGAPGVNHWRMRLKKALDALEGNDVY